MEGSCIGTGDVKGDGLDDLILLKANGEEWVSPSSGMDFGIPYSAKGN